MDDEIGGQTGKLASWDESAKTAEGFLNNRDLNPHPLSWKQKLARVAAAGVAAAGLYIGGKAAYENLSAPPEYFGEPYGDGIPLLTDLVMVEDNHKKLVEPTYRSKPSTGGKELTEEEMRERGYNPVMREGVIIQEVKGGTYPDNPLVGKGRIEEDGETYGVWGEILMPKLGGNIGEYTRTGIYVSENFIDQEASDKVNIENGEPKIFAREPKQ